MKNSESKTRFPVVSGTFYPGSKAELEKSVRHYLDQAVDVPIATKKLYGIISPHAGYVYSGGVAAVGYRLLQKYPAPTIVVIAPSHREYFEGASTFSGTAYETLLGRIPVSEKLCNLIAENGETISRSLSGHREEHSLEVQLPFLQMIFPDGFELVPIVMGTQKLNVIKDLSYALNKAAKKSDFVVVASSDLSHYHSYNMAVQKDKKLISLLEEYEIDKLEAGCESQRLEACGLGPILSLMEYAKLRGNPSCKALEYKNSGDTSGMKMEVVGYVSAAIFES